MSDLKKELIRLGSTTPSLRPHIRQVLRHVEASATAAKSVVLSTLRRFGDWRLTARVVDGAVEASFRSSVLDVSDFDDENEHYFEAQEYLGRVRSALEQALGQAGIKTDRIQVYQGDKDYVEVYITFPKAKELAAPAPAPVEPVYYSGDHYMTRAQVEQLASLVPPAAFNAFVEWWRKAVPKLQQIDRKPDVRIEKVQIDPGAKFRVSINIWATKPTYAELEDPLAAISGRYNKYWMRFLHEERYWSPGYPDKWVLTCQLRK